MRLLGYILAVVLLLAAAAAFVLLAPFGPGSETYVDLPSGTTTPRMAAQLAQAGVIRSRLAFELLRVVRGGRLKAGEYRFDGSVPLTVVYDRIVRGDVYTRTVVIPEGFNIFDIAAAAEAAGLGSHDAFLAAAHTQTGLIASLLAPGAPAPDSLEGFLFPDTYRFSRHATPEIMLAAMVHRFRQAAARIGLNTDIRSTVTLASIVEKEVRQPEERPLVASVFVNRLADHMPLQTDPTVIYAALLENRFRGTIYASDLQSPSVYNTYRHTGLPPGPICSPGIAALQAVMHPPKTDYLYFVSDAAGHSRFARTLAEHARNVEAYRAAAH